MLFRMARFHSIFVAELTWSLSLSSFFLSLSHLLYPFIYWWTFNLLPYTHTHTQEAFHPKAAWYTSFAIAHGTFSRKLTCYVTKQILVNLRKLKSYQAYFSVQAETGNQLLSCKMQTKQTNKKTHTNKCRLNNMPTKQSMARWRNKKKNTNETNENNNKNS